MRRSHDNFADIDYPFPETGLLFAFPPGEPATRMIAALGKMPESEVEALAATLPPEEAALVKDSARALRQAQGQPLIEVLSPALETYWKTNLRGIIRAKLLNLSVTLQNPPRSRTDL